MPDLKSRLESSKFGDISLQHLKKEYIEVLESVFGKEGFKKFMPYILGYAHVKFIKRQKQLESRKYNKKRKLFKERDTREVRFTCNPKVSKKHTELENGNATYFLITLNEALKELVQNAGSVGNFTSMVDKDYENIFGFKISKAEGE